MSFPEAQELLLEATCTDSYAGKVYPLRIFLNGEELATTGIEAVTGQGNEVRYYDLHAFTSLLREGVNTIGVIVRNTWTADFDDVAFDLSLKAIPYSPGSAKLTLDQTGPSIAVEAVTPPGTIWQLRSCESINCEPWRLLEVFTNSARSHSPHSRQPARFTERHAVLPTGAVLKNARLCRVCVTKPGNKHHLLDLFAPLERELRLRLHRFAVHFNDGINHEIDW